MKEKLNVNGVIKALKYFSSLKEQKIYSIYALRCAFAHDYSLFNNSADPRLRHHFVVITGLGEPVKLPLETWSGDFHSKNQQVTAVDLWELGELVESVCRRLLSLAKADLIEVTLKGGAYALELTYLMLSPMKPA